MTATVLSPPAPPSVAAAPDGRPARRDAAVRLAATAVLWLSLLAVAYWWAAGGGFQSLAGWLTFPTSLGRLTVLAASDLLLVQVLLLARVPVLERAFGQDRLVGPHRLTGFTSFNLMVAHVVLITWGYAATGRDHPRRAGLALQLGAVLGLPTVGVTSRPLIAEGAWPVDQRGATTPLLVGGEVVGCWVRTRAGAKPVAVHAAWQTDAQDAVQVVLAATRRARTPEPLRRARTLARTRRAHTR